MSGTRSRSFTVLATIGVAVGTFVTGGAATASTPATFSWDAPGWGGPSGSTA